MRIDSSGRVGIGETNPAVDLHITNSGSTQLLLESGTDALGYLLFGDPADSNVGSVSYDHSNNSMRFETNDSERMSISSTGAINHYGDSINAQTSASYYIRNRVNGGSLNLGVETSAGALYYPITASGTSNVTIFRNATTEIARFNTSGSLLMNTTATDGRISIDNAGYATQTLISLKDSEGSGTHTQISFANTNGVVGTINTASTSTTYNTSSDQRLKDNIVDAPSSSDDIDAIQVRSFDWKADGSHQKYGMVAQELNTVAPIAVTEGETEEDMMGVDYSKLVPMLVKEIQSLRARVAQLEND